MRVSESEIPVGATWRYTAPEGIGLWAGARASITLERRDGDLEMWVWRFCLADGSDARQDWAPSFRKASDECHAQFGGLSRGRIRFLRDRKQGDE